MDWNKKLGKGSQACLTPHCNTAHVKIIFVGISYVSYAAQETIRDKNRHKCTILNAQLILILKILQIFIKNWSSFLKYKFSSVQFLKSDFDF